MPSILNSTKDGPVELSYFQQVLGSQLISLERKKKKKEKNGIECIYLGRLMLCDHKYL